MYKNKRLIISLVVFFLLFSLVGCSQPQNTNKNEDKVISINDDGDNLIELKEPANKVVSLAPSHTETLFALGLDDEIVGVTEYCDYPKEALEKEKIGTFLDADIEKIVSINPDIVLSTGNLDDSKIDTLKKADIQVVYLDSKSIEDVFSSIDRIGILVGKEKKAKELVDGMEKRKNEIVEKVKGAENVDVFYEVWNEPLTAAGKGSFMDELINLAGGENIISDSEVPYPEIDSEILIKKNPQVYLTADDGNKTAKDIENRQGYESIDAIKNGKIYLLDEDISSRPGPRIIDALELVAKSIHPDLF